ncbi:unnamed protein product [Linum trigynum]|uniref:Uncharacterized protein n=1 Tax=Linum trigynum TaxID=586398 RepID=A0AAV2GT69_9ROSI
MENQFFSVPPSRSQSSSSSHRLIHPMISSFSLAPASTTIQTRKNRRRLFSDSPLSLRHWLRDRPRRTGLQELGLRRLVVGR